jgi:hypothetical protein
MTLRPRDDGGVIGLPATMVAAHAIFMLWVLFAWVRAVGLHGFVTGNEATLAQSLVSWLDFAVYPLCVTLETHLVRSPLIWRVLAVDQITALSVKLLWPLLLVAGSVQWLLIGLAITVSRRWWSVRKLPSA